MIYEYKEARLKARWARYKKGEQILYTLSYAKEIPTKLLLKGVSVLPARYNFFASSLFKLW